MPTATSPAHVVGKVRPSPAVPAISPLGGASVADLLASAAGDTRPSGLSAVSLPITRSALPPTDAHDWPIVVPRPDTSGRIQVKAIGDALGWSRPTKLPDRLVPAESTVLVRGDGPDHLTIHCTYDSAGRLTLPSRARGTLGIHRQAMQVVDANVQEGLAVIPPGHLLAENLAAMPAVIREQVVLCG